MIFLCCGFVLLNYIVCFCMFSCWIFCSFEFILMICMLCLCFFNLFMSVFDMWLCLSCVGLFIDLKFGSVIVCCIVMF